MSIYAGLDVSDKTTHICVVDVDGKVLRRDVVESDPDFLAKWLNKHCSDLTRVVLETGTLSTFLYHGLVERGVAIECICARHAKGVLSARVNKSDVHDAEGLAQLARTGWYKRVHMKASATHIDRAALRIRAQLITARTSMANQLRGLLKLFGLRMGTARTPGRRTERLTAFYAQRPDLKALFAPLIASMETIEEQLRTYNRLLTDRAKADEVSARLMSVHAIEAIDDGGERYLAGRDLELRNVGEPFFVRRLRVEIAIDQVLGRRTDLAQVRAKAPPFGLGDDQAFLLHQPLHNLLRDCHALFGQRRLYSAIAVAAVIGFEDCGNAAPNDIILVSEVHPGVMVEVRASRQTYLGEQLRQPIDIFEGVNQLCLLPISQEVQIDAQAFFKSSLALFRRSCSSCS
jgi:hypothetical protein